MPRRHNFNLNIKLSVILSQFHFLRKHAIETRFLHDKLVPPIYDLSLRRIKKIIVHLWNMKQKLHQYEKFSLNLSFLICNSIYS